MPSPNTWGSLRERGGEGHLSLDVLFVGVGLNSSRLLLRAIVTGRSLAHSGANWKGKWLVLERIIGRNMG